MSRARNRKLIKIVVVAAVLGSGYWYVAGYTLPVYHYESSDRGMAEFEIPWKGRHLAGVEQQFEEYKASTGDPDLTLCRTSKRKWSAPNLWRDNLTNPRWDLPYMPPSPEPNYRYWTSIPRANPQREAANTSVPATGER